MPVVGVPKTIDNDLDATLATFGFESAVSCAVDALDRLHSTAESHNRVMVLEVMGRYAGWIAGYAGLAGGADVILIPEIPFNYDSIVAKIREREAMGKHFTLVAVAEGARPAGGAFVTAGDAGSNREARPGWRRSCCGERDRETHGQGDSRGRAGPSPARRRPHRLGSPALHAVRLVRRRDDRRGALRHDGRPDPRRHRLRASSRTPSTGFAPSRPTASWCAWAAALGISFGNE